MIGNGFEAPLVWQRNPPGPHNKIAHLPLRCSYHPFRLSDRWSGPGHILERMKVKNQTHKGDARKDGRIVKRRHTVL